MGLLLLLLLLPAARAQTYVPGQAYFGRSNYIEYVAGDMPVIFSAPHGGALTPAEIPDRVDDGTDPQFTTVTDSYTEETAFAVQAAFASYFGHLPHVIVCQLKRTKIDCNRSLYQGVYDTNAYATIAWNEFQNYIDTASNSAVAQNGQGFYIDLHGQGHPIQRLELGYLLTADQLTNSDAVLNLGSYPPQTSIRTLAGIVQRKFGMPFSQLLRGTNSFGAFMAAQGYPSIPDPQMPNPGDGTNPIVYPGDQNDYFDGGYNTAVHGSQSGAGPLDSLQIEANMTGVRDTALDRTNYGLAIARTLDYFFTNYYGLDLRISTPSIWPGGAGKWGTAGGWADGVLPVSGDYLLFSGAGGPVSNNLPALTTGGGVVYSVIFGTNATGSYTLYGNPVSLKAGLTNFSSSPQIISNALSLLTPQCFAAPASPLTFGGSISNGGFSLTILAATNVILNNALSGAGGLTKLGGGTLTLNAASSYAGGTTNQVGLLLADNAVGTATGPGPLLVNAGAALGGTGIVSGPVTMNGLLTPGNPAGTLTITNGLNVTATGGYVWTLAADTTNSPGVDYDQIVLTGGSLAIDSNSSLTIAFTNSATAPAMGVAFWQAPHSWKILALATGAANPGSAAFAVISNNAFAAGKFVSSADAQGNVLLRFLPTPPPVISPFLPGAGTSGASISWSTVPGVTYEVDYATNLAPAKWLPLGSITATSTNTTLTDPATDPNRFYRVLIP